MLQTVAGHMSALAKVTDEFITEHKLENSLYTYLGKTAKMLCLFHANYKCENPNCRSMNKLTVHHLIGKKNSYYLSPAKYFRQRMYYGNQVILCTKCHCKIEYRKLQNWTDHDVISKETIEETKLYLEDK